MSVPKRHNTIPGVYFITSRTWESRAVFIKASACALFLETMERYRGAGKFALHAFVLMPEHFHILLTPGAAVSLERAVMHIKGGSAHTMREKLGFRFPVWQRGFSDHRIRDVRDYSAHLLYIEQNPVKRRLVEIAKEYPWSSACGGFRLDEPPQGLKPRPMRRDRHG